jgi:hypothetical protein
LQRVSESKDNVSTGLEAIFNNAVGPTAQQLQRARDRKELGNPPGKPGDPLGDQVTWEQLLDRLREGKINRLWIISSDGDFGTFTGGQGYLNPLLMAELRNISPELQVYLFKNASDGLKHYTSLTGAKHDKLPPDQELQEIKKEEDLLPSLLLPDEAEIKRWAQWREEQFRLAGGTGYMVVPVYVPEDRLPPNSFPPPDSTPRR